MENSATASEIRNLLYGLNGYLFDRARNKSEQKLTWEEYAARLSFYGRIGHEYEQIVKQGKVYTELINALSSGAKDRRSLDLDDIWTRVIDHIYVVLRSIKL